MKEYALGIDFGTTNSAVGIASSITDLIDLVPVDGNNVTIPTALFYGVDKKILLGRSAVQNYIEGEDGRFIRSIKRILGTELMEKSTIVNGVSLKFDTIIQTFLAYLKAKAEAHAQQEINSVVIGRPVHFQDEGDIMDQKAQKKLETLAQKVGFKNISFQYEPIAAAFAHEQKQSKDLLAFVVDLGGGTSDFTIMKIGPSYRSKKDRADDILATNGIRIGGNDLDREFSLQSFMPSFGKGTVYGPKNLQVPYFLYAYLSEWSQINFCYTLKNKLLVKEILLQSQETIKIKRLYDLLDLQLAHNFLKVVEDTKITLTEHEIIETKFTELDAVLNFSVSQKELNMAIREDLCKIQSAIRETLKQASLPESAIDFVILTGGTCEVPAVQQMMRQFFSNAYIAETEKMESVCMGLTLTAQRLFF